MSDGKNQNTSDDATSETNWLEFVSRNATPEMYTRTLTTWSEVMTLTNWRLPRPSVGLGEDEEVMLCWDAGRHHFEIELIPGKPTEVFYRDRDTENSWGTEWLPEDSVPEELLPYLEFFIPAH
jgi:hypothetical protein